MATNAISFEVASAMCTAVCLRRSMQLHRVRARRTVLRVSARGRGQRSAASRVLPSPPQCIKDDSLWRLPPPLVRAVFLFSVSVSHYVCNVLSMDWSAARPRPASWLRAPRCWAGDGATLATCLIPGRDAASLEGWRGRLSPGGRGPPPFAPGDRRCDLARAGEQKRGRRKGGRRMEGTGGGKGQAKRGAGSKYGPREPQTSCHGPETGRSDGANRDRPRPPMWSAVPPMKVSVSVHLSVPPLHLPVHLHLESVSFGISNGLRA